MAERKQWERPSDIGACRPPKYFEQLYMHENMDDEDRQKPTYFAFKRLTQEVLFLYEIARFNVKFWAARNVMASLVPQLRRLDHIGYKQDTKRAEDILAKLDEAIIELDQKAFNSAQEIYGNMRRANDGVDGNSYEG